MRLSACLVRHAVLSSTALSALALVAAPVAAQTARDDARVIEELVITAQKRTQSALDVPITVSAFDQDALDTLRISEFDQLSDFTPGLVVQEQSPNNPAFVIRGITSDSGDSQIAPRVTIYENGFDVSRSRGSQFELYDLERIEVVKGPQATLFGTASLVGAVSVITAKPEQELGASAELSYGNYDFVKARGHITGGNDWVQGRLAVSYRRRDGFVDNIAGTSDSQTPDGPAVRDLNGLDIFAIRPSVRFTPTDDLTVDLVANYQKETPPATAFKSGVLRPTGGDTSPFSFAELGGSPFSREVLGDELGLDRERYTLNLTADWQVSDAISVSSVTGYLNFDSLEVFDADGSPAFLLEFGEDATGESVSQEFRLNYDGTLGGNPFAGFVGVNYFHENGEQGVPFSTDESILAACVTPNPNNNPALLADPATASQYEINALRIQPFCQNADASINRIDFVPGSPSFGLPVPVNSGAGVAVPYAASFTNTANLDTFSVFLDGSYTLFDRLELTGGIRYIHESRQGGAFTNVPDASVAALQPLIGALFPIDTGGVEVTDKRSFDAVVGRFNALYRFTDDVNAYVTIGRGRRSPVVQVDPTRDAQGRLIAATQIIDDEILWNYEGGVKADLADGRAVIEAAVFYQAYQDFQTTINTPDGFETVTAGDANNIGVEGALSGRLTDWLSYFSTVAYTEGQIDDDDENGIFAGTRFRLQPRWTASAGATVDRVVLDRWRVFGTLSWTHRSSVFFEQENRPIAGLPLSEGPVNLVNLQAGVGTADGRWEVTGFASNLNNAEYIIDAGNTGGTFGTPTFIQGAPRFFGIELRANY
ncbi:outer membrane receptor protein involved in Fe transport [Rhodothalassium salexigens DSM 2132]|uniref:Outer membrane receptor protein involved in Fe transport n=1 Tax=Rhodothalassium salexigens DSM 2132 TaxID=1188247 RepID=A0A4R2PEY3_RHOSA|nr:TonB-dependent receptor [Rhodothalassium salexigens]MBB4211851.1 outer membrane receptor protein involved in Fe transport [Rhodothalassium salexigens DSM 2132]MBK1638852.1 hypothetical protein [Rhodothalassium salexigens DSM 2132]TCP33853.1 outer membrane receptor protein involved in Fe transport [Rhodothalassium salexigens DSM 2132]